MLVNLYHRSFSRNYNVHHAQHSFILPDMYSLFSMNVKLNPWSFVSSQSYHFKSF